MIYRRNFLLLLAQGCQNSDGTRSIGVQSKAAFKGDVGETTIHYDGGNENRYVVDYKCVYICMHSLHMYITSSLRFIAYYNLLLQDLSQYFMTILLTASYTILSGIFLENKFRRDKSSLSKIEGGRT